MNSKELIQYWTTSAADDWHTTQSLYEKQEYVSALFFAHLYLEKLLKALIVQQTQEHAPYGHSLPKLSEKANLSLTRKQSLLLVRMTRYNIETRYPDYKFALKKRATQSFCQTELEQAEAFGKWLRSMLAS